VTSSATSWAKAIRKSEVNYIDSSGIGVLVSSFSTVRGQGGELKLVNPSKRICDLLQITKLYTLFDVKGRRGHGRWVLPLVLLRCGRHAHEKKGIGFLRCPQDTDWISRAVTA
jgi:hypothetical protein